MRLSLFISYLTVCTIAYSQPNSQSDSLPISNTQLTVAEMLKKLPGPKGEQYAQGMNHGTMQVLIYAPKMKDEQTPHDKDEVYIVVSGSGIFFDGKRKYPFKRGDVLFVPAYTEHRFENFSDDFVTWVIFYGPEGGEKLVGKLKTETRIIIPRDTDPDINEFTDNGYTHHVLLNHEAKKRNQLLVFLTGTGGQGGTARSFNTYAANLGYHVINLIYPDSISMASICRRNPDVDCFENAREESISGKDMVKGLEISKANAIENRLIKVLIYLQNKYPTENWSQFRKDKDIRWEKVVISGQSQGGGHAAYIAKKYKVARVLMFASPKDYGIAYNKPAKWIFSKTKTPADRYFAFTHSSDSLGCTFSQQLEIFNVMGLYKYGRLENVDSKMAPFNHSRILTSTRPIKTTTAHSGPVSLREYEFVWQYMLTEPIKSN